MRETGNQVAERNDWTIGATVEEALAALKEKLAR
jgi:hypothetical protein